MNTSAKRSEHLYVAARRQHVLGLIALVCLGAAILAGILTHPFDLGALFKFLSPWWFSPTVLATTLAAGALYANGLRLTTSAERADRFWRPLAFFTGLVLVYLMLQTRINYLAGHMFFMHRFQHIFLHHIGPFLLALAAPQAVLLRGMPRIARERLVLPVARNRVVRGIFRVIQNPVVGAILFVGLIYVWLLPPIFFDAMLSIKLYKLMNWSMAIDGALFWWLILNPRKSERSAYLLRMLVLWAITIPQIILGAYLALTSTDVYPVYKLCGRAFAMNPLMDQHIGGLIIWIPGSMMSVVVILILFRRMVRAEDVREQQRVSLKQV
jgi:putative membrane protein